MTITADLAQTFVVDKESVRKSGYVYIDSIDLFFGSKPSAQRLPGVTVYITETYLDNNVPIPDLNKQVKYGRTRLEYNDINVDLATPVVSKFKFTVPVLIKTNTTYGVIIKFDYADTNFTLWRNKAGDAINNSISTPVSSALADGKFFIITNGSNLTPLNDVDLMYTVRVQKFVTDTPFVYSAYNRSFEFLNTDGYTKAGDFFGGEYVFTNIPPPAGQTVSISTTSNTVTGNGTTFQSTFTNTSLIVLKSGDQYAVRSIQSITNNTLLTLKSTGFTTNTQAQYVVSPVARVYEDRSISNNIVLISSTANATCNFYPNTVSNTVIGEASNAYTRISSVDNFTAARYQADFNIITLPFTEANTTMRLSNSAYYTSTEAKDVQQFKTEILLSRAYIFSASDEAANGSTLSNRKSANFDITFKTSNEFVSPLLDEEDMHFHVDTVYINDNVVDENTRAGKAVAKYIGKPITLASGQEAEDIVVYATAYRPPGTDVKVYAKFYNELDYQYFEDKDWTELEVIGGKNLYSSIANINDLIEFTYKLPVYPVYSYLLNTSGVVQPGRFTGANNSNIITSSVSGVNTSIANTDLVRIYNPLTPNTSLMAVVTGSDDTTLTIDTTLSTSNSALYQFVSSGLVVEKVTNKNTAFKNYVSGNVIRYYNTDMSAFDTYSKFSIKVVLTANSNVDYFPFVDDIRGIAISL
jgi:hypothetical protein